MTVIKKAFDTVQKDTLAKRVASCILKRRNSKMVDVQNQFATVILPGFAKH
jgi:hypothetical protein